jgi:hypothetical protein
MPQSKKSNAAVLQPLQIFLKRCLGHLPLTALHAGSTSSLLMCLEVNVLSCLRMYLTGYAARKFWSEALGWKFREADSGPDGRQEDPNKIAHIESFKDCPGGGITKTNEVLRTEGKGGTILYLYVNDLEDTERVRNCTT